MVELMFSTRLARRDFVPMPIELAERGGPAQFDDSEQVELGAVLARELARVRLRRDQSQQVC
jgi:hypothetical protein